MSDNDSTEKRHPESKRQDGHPNLLAGGPNMVKGGPSLNPGGRKKALRDIEDMIDSEFRTPETIRFALTRAKELGFAETEIRSDKDGVEFVLTKADAAFATLFLNRVLGPVKELEEIDLSNAPPEALEFIKSLKGN